MKTALQVLAIVCSVALLGGYVWYAQQSVGPTSVGNPAESLAPNSHDGSSDITMELDPDDVTFGGLINFQEWKTQYDPPVNIVTDKPIIMPGSKSLVLPVFSSRKVEDTSGINMMSSSKGGRVFNSPPIPFARPLSQPDKAPERLPPPEQP